MIAADVANAGNAIIFGACSATQNSLVSIELCERIAAEVIMKKAAYNRRFGKKLADGINSATVRYQLQFQRDGILLNISINNEL